MIRSFWGSLIVIAVAVFAGGYWWFSQGAQLTSQDVDTAAGQAESAQGPVAPVEVAPIKEGTIAEEITVYGTIVPAAGAVQAIAVPFESRVRRILVTEGQQVSKGEPLLEIEPSAETNLQTQQARSEYQAAQKALQYMQQRFDLKLATNDQLLQTHQALEQAQAKLESLRRRGSEGAQTIHADAASLVSKVAVQEAAIVSAGNAMIEMVTQNRLQARLGIEPADSSKVKAGQEVSLARINVPGTHAVIGRIRKLSQAANATSQLVDGFVDLPSSSGFLLNEYVAGRISCCLRSGVGCAALRGSPRRRPLCALYRQRRPRPRTHRAGAFGECTRGRSQWQRPCSGGAGRDVGKLRAERRHGRQSGTVPMNFTRWVQVHRRSVLFLLTVLVLGGLASIPALPVALFPHVIFPRVMVNIDSGDRPAERMMIEVTFPIEEGVRAIPGVRGVRSTTSRGSAEISINFDWGEDMVAALLQVESAINQVMPNLPQGTTFNARRMDPTVFPVLAYSLTSDAHSLVDLRDIALYQLRPLISTITGVAKVEILGGAQREYQINVNPARLDSYGLSLSDVAKSLSAANVIEAVGRMEDHYKLYLAMSDTRFLNLGQIRDTMFAPAQEACPVRQCGYR